MHKKRPRSVTIIAAICIALSLIGIVYLSLSKVRVGYDPSVLLFLIWWINLFVEAIGLLRGRNWARRLIMFYLGTLVLWVLPAVMFFSAVLIFEMTCQLELHLNVFRLLVSLGIFLSLFIFWIAVLIVMNKPSVKSFFHPTQEVPEKKQSTTGSNLQKSFDNWQ
jgi:hypothetical protein